MARPSTRGGEFVASSALFVAVAVDFAAQQRRQLRLLGYEVVHFPCVVAKVVELLFPVLRRGDELVQLLPIAVEDRKPVGQEIGLVIREPCRSRGEERFAFPRRGNRQAKPVENGRGDVHLRRKRQVGVDGSSV